MKYFCCDKQRRDRVLGHPPLNGIDFLEVEVEDNLYYLDVHFLNSNGLDNLKQENVQIEGGEFIRDVAVDPDTPLRVTGRIVSVQVKWVNKPGDSTYTLRLIGGPDTTQPPEGFDPLLSTVEFSFQITGPSDFDCRTVRICPPAPQVQPEINYLAKDYASFRRLMLDRMALLMPEWQERNPADLGVALVELLAYVGDHLSYQQDAVATEAYLGTARRRVSVRRHARLVDYHMHDGCNARVWVCLEVAEGKDGTVLSRIGPAGAPRKFLTRCGAEGTVIDSDRWQEMPSLYSPEVFEPLHDITLYKDHNPIKFYTWEDARCCLPKGATQATLCKNLPHLHKGDVLILEQEQVLEPQTGRLEEVDLTRRHAVRLQKVVSDWLALTQDTLDALEIMGVPSRVLLTLKGLENKRFYGEEEFLQAVATTLGAAWLDFSLWGDGPGLYGQYYEFEEPGFDTGKRKRCRQDQTINFEWPQSPDPAVREDRFAVRWMGRVKAKVSGGHTFYTTSDDGVRLWVNGRKIIDNWMDHAAKQDPGYIELTAGQEYDLRLDYYERTGGAVIRLEWQAPNLPREVIPPSQWLSYSGEPGLAGRYYEFDAEPGFDPERRKLGRRDPQIDFEWARKPDPLVRQDRFAVRWTGMVTAKRSGVHTFYTTSDDGVRLWVDKTDDHDALLIDNWTDHLAKVNEGQCTLTDHQQYRIRLEYYQRGFEAAIKLEWEADSLPREVIPASQLSDSGQPGLQGEYYEFDEPGFDPNRRKRVRQDLEINFEWARKPDPAIRENRFAVRWLGRVKPRVSGRHAFYTISDDGVRLWVNGTQIINNWTDHSPQEDGPASVELKEGQEYPIRLEYYEREFESVIRLKWQAPDQRDKEVIPSSQLLPPAERTLQALLLKYASRTPLTDPLTAKPITEIEWAAEDALPFPLCLSASDSQGNLVEDLSCARGNVVLADHGWTVTENLEPVPEDRRRWVLPPGADRCQPPIPVRVPARFRPRLTESPLTHTGMVTKTVWVNGRRKQEELPFDQDQPASAAFRWDMAAVLPAIRLTEANQPWEPRRDLLGSNKTAPVFVVEVEEDGSACLRFGDGVYHGQRPEVTTRFTATYRVGNGARGNIGAESLAHVVGNSAVDPAVAAITGVRNPLPARGGVEPERLEDVRQRAPAAFRTQQRAVTPDDYAAAAQRHPQVRRAAASFRWTGSWRTVFLVVERMGGLPVDPAFKEELRRYMEPYRLAGHDLEIDTPRYVALEIDMKVNVKPDYFRSKVRQSLLNLFNNRLLPDGRRGVFHPDNFGFGLPVYLSPLYAAAQAVAGVVSVEVEKFQRQGVASQQAISEGKLMLDRLEIARLDNDLNFPEHGVLRLTLKGGK